MLLAGDEGLAVVIFEVVLPGSGLAFVVEDVDVSIDGELALFRGSVLDVLVEFDEKLEGVVGGLLTFEDEFEDPLDTVVVVEAETDYYY